MSRFRAGDVCVIVDHATPRRFAGMECTIAGEEGWYHCDDGPFFGYPVTISDGTNEYAARAALRLRRPPSWDQWLYTTKDVEREREDSNRNQAEASRTDVLVTPVAGGQAEYPAAPAVAP